MAASKEPAVGIDLGTTFSVAAYLDAAGQPQTLVNAEGERLTPSVVLIAEDEVVVGREAVKAMETDIARVADCAKRDVGQRAFHKPLGGHPYPPEALEAWVLNKLRLDTQKRIGAYQKVVITVPAYFDEVRRKATQDAGYIAGFDVMDIINEPTAAAVAFGLERGFLSDEGVSRQRQRILVYDLGGGTFDVTVMEITGRDFVALATDGDVRLGGRDWDQRLVDCVAEDFVRQHGVDPREDPNVEGRLWRECEEAKRTLSVRSQTRITSVFDGQVARLDMTRARFEDMTLDLLERTLFTTRQTLQAAGLAWSQLDRVLLVGGATRMPAVVRALQELAGQEPDQSVSPDEAVAHGAAQHAGLLLARHAGQAPRFRIRNVNSHSLGVVAHDPRTRQTRNAILIPRNTPLPADARRVFRTQKRGQKSILVQIVEGESAAPDDCAPVGRCSVCDLPADLPAQTAIEVRFRYLDNGRLSVEVTVAGTDTRLKHDIMRENSLTVDQLNSWRKYVSGLPPTARVLSDGVADP